MLMTNEDIMQLMNDVHNVFFKHYRDIRVTKDSPEWDEIIRDVNKLMEKYKRFQGTKFVRNENGKLIETKYYVANDIVKTLKGWDPTVNTTTTRSTIEKKAEVVGKSARFAILKYENGITEAFLWSDLIGFKKNSSMKKKS